MFKSDKKSFFKTLMPLTINVSLVYNYLKNLEKTIIEMKEIPSILSVIVS